MTTTTPATIITTDQNTGREIVWTVESAHEHPRSTPNGFTHFCIVTRPNGTAAHSIHAVIDAAGNVVRTSTARRI